MTFDLASASGPCVLIGAGGHARVVASSLQAGALIAVLDADPTRVGGELAGCRIILDSGSDAGRPVHLAVGSNGLRARLAAARSGARFRTVVHPSALIASDAEIDEGAFVAMGARVQTGTRIGAHVIVNTGAIVEHDCLVGNFCHVAPGAILAGAVRLEHGVLVGAGAIVLPGLTIGREAVVGAGAVVTRDIPAGQTVAGSPARST